MNEWQKPFSVNKEEIIERNRRKLDYATKMAQIECPLQTEVRFLRRNHGNRK